MLDTVYLVVLGLLHACGDVSLSRLQPLLRMVFAPRMWRCFSASAPKVAAGCVCSTHVEMFLCLMALLVLLVGLLHACGDVSLGVFGFQGRFEFAPRMWRCFLLGLLKHFHRVVCSTHVEMFLTTRGRGLIRGSLLHACGDVSKRPTTTHSTSEFAPRMWRCFFESCYVYGFSLVCSTHVEMFP